MRDFPVFIMTHGRADRVFTYKALREGGYTGRIIIVIDTDDDQGERYKQNFGVDNVVVFDKNEYEKKMDTGDAHGSMKCVVFARNACFDIAQKLGYKYFIEADDDYNGFFVRRQEGEILREFPLLHLDEAFDAMFDFLEESGALSVAPAQGGDFIGGARGAVWRDKLRRKCMNLFFCKTDSPIHFIGRINEDVTSYSYYGSQGKLFFTTAEWGLHQQQTQKQSGGMTDTYLEGGTLLKSFYSVMWMPSAVKIVAMGESHARIHHQVAWNNCVPCILDEKWRK